MDDAIISTLLAASDKYCDYLTELMSEAQLEGNDEASQSYAVELAEIEDALIAGRVWMATRHDGRDSRE